MYETNPRPRTRRALIFLRRLAASRMGLHDLTSQGFVNVVHGRLEADCTALGEQILSWHMGFDFNHFVVARLALFNTQKDLTTLDVTIEGEELLEFCIDKIQKRLVSIEMNGVNLNLHRTRRLVTLRIPMVQWRSLVELLQLCCRVLRVHLRRRQTCMAEEILDGREFGPSIQEVRGKRMPKNVRTALLQAAHLSKVVIDPPIHK